MRNNLLKILRQVLTLSLLFSYLAALVPVSLRGQTSTTKTKDLTSKSNSINRQKNPISEGNLNKTVSRSVFFEENRGQHNKKVKFASRRGRDTLYLTPTEAVFMLPLISDEEKKDFGNFDFFGKTMFEERFAKLNKAIDEKELWQERSQPQKFVPLRMKMIGANPNAQMKGTEETPTKVNYFNGNDESKWRTDIPTFGRVVAENVYQGIGLEWYGTAEGEYEYDFKVKPNADLRQIELEFEGASKLETDDEGNLLIYTKAGIIRQNKPYSYQKINDELKEVTSGFEIKSGNKVGFTVANYNKQKELTIDPTLVYSTYIGGSGYNPYITPREGGDYFGGMDVDAQGSAVISSQTYSTDYPITPGSYDTTINGDSDIIVSRFRSDGRILIYSTYIGGTETEWLVARNNLTVDSQGNACLAISSGSTDFPTTQGAFQRRHNGGLRNLSGQFPMDVVVFKFPPQGNQLIFSTFFGGTSSVQGKGSDLIGGLILDNNDNIYLSGYTNSQNLPVSANAYQTHLTTVNSVNGFVAKLNATGSAMIFSTYFGGSAGEIPCGIALDETGGIYITGVTGSIDFPTTPGAFDRTYNPPILNTDLDGFVTKFNPNLSALVYSTYLGGSRDNRLRTIKVDNLGQAYIFGQTFSTNFPVTPNAYSTVGDGAIITKLNRSGSALLYSTYFPAGGVDLILETDGNLILAGYATSGLPATPNAFDRSPDFVDAGLIRFNPSTNQILYATAFGGKIADSTFGGDYGDEAVSVAKDAAGNIYLAGGTNTVDFPTTEGAFDRTWNGYGDNYIAKFSFAPNSITNLSGRTRHRLIPVQQSKGIARIRIKLTDNQTGEVRYQMTRPTGRYEFRNLPANRNYTIEVSDKRRFTNTIETIQNAEGDIGGIDFILVP